MDRLYKIIYYEYMKDLNKNMVELYINPDEELILYLDSIPKLEPKILMSLKGFKPDNTIFQCEYYATVDNISNFYNFDTNYLVFIIDTNLTDITYDYATFPKAQIRDKFKIQECEEEKTPFKGSAIPPLSVYDPNEMRFTTNLKKPKPQRNTLLKKLIKKNNVLNYECGDNDDDWEKNTCSHGLCKAEQTTEPPLLNSLVDVSDTIEYFEHLDCIKPPKKKQHNVICFNKSKLLWGLIFLILGLLLFKCLSNRKSLFKNKY
jgi:hypothetical protein